jgi:Flp pilus assembly protein CpaB
MLMVALVLGIASFALMLAFMSSRGGDNKAIEEQLAGPGSESVLVATRDIKVGEKITSDMFVPKTIPAGGLLDGRISDPTAVLDKVASAPIFTGEQLTSVKVTSYDGQNSLAFKVPQGMRALSLTVPHEAWITGGLPQPGDRIDVLGLTVLSKTDPLTGQERPDLTAGYIAQDIEVLAVAQTMVQSVKNIDQAKTPVAAGSATPGASVTATPSTTVTAGGNTNDGQALATGDTFEKAISITLALTPEDAAKVAIIDSMDDNVGQYRIVVRQKGDDTPMTGTKTWTLDDVFAKSR